MEHLIPFRPFFQLIIVLISNGGINRKKIPALLPWVVKIILFEPLRLVEAIYFLLRRLFIKKKPPIFILGFYRSGTTWLQQLMNCDPDFGTPTLFQTVLPEIMLVTEPILKPMLQFLCKKLKVKNNYHRLTFNWDFPGEEEVALNALSYRCDFNKLFQFPSRAEKIISNHFSNSNKKKLKRWAKAHMYFTDKVSLKNLGKRLILKSPPNTGKLALLKKVYPDARFVFIKRDLETCLQSNKRLWKLNQQFSFENYTEDQAFKVSQEMYAIFDDCYQRDKQILKEDELVEVAYDELVKDPIVVLDKIYKTLKIPNSNYKRALRQKLVNERKGYKPIDWGLIDRKSVGLGILIFIQSPNPAKLYSHLLRFY